MRRKGVVALRLSCSVPVKGNLTLETAASHRSSKKKRKLTLARRRLSLRAGRSTLVLKLTRKGRRAVLRHKHLRVRARMTLQGAVDPSRSARTLTINAPRRRPRR
jgi:hypothetical protein